MSFESVVNAVNENPALLDELKAANTPKERAAILDAHGIAKPHADSEFTTMPEVAGGKSSTTSDVVAGSAAIG
ncbi:MAG: Nif11-like leader peptide family natural product precursor [Actinomycetota bacterium]